MLGTSADMKTIKAKCSNDITYGDIKVVIAEKNRQASKGK